MRDTRALGKEKAYQAKKVHKFAKCKVIYNVLNGFANSPQGIIYEPRYLRQPLWDGLLSALGMGAEAKQVDYIAFSIK